MSTDADPDGFITRREFNDMAEELLRRAKAQADRQHFERKRSALVMQGRWAPPLPKEGS